MNQIFLIESAIITLADRLSNLHFMLPISKWLRWTIDMKYNSFSPVACNSSKNKQANLS